jgi:hypothetical protein
MAANLNSERIMARYLEIYQSLYRRAPSELRDLGNNWVLVNGARMTLQELEQLTEQLHHEFLLERERKRSVLKRLVGWFAKTG